MGERVDRLKCHKNHRLPTAACSDSPFGRSGCRKSSIERWVSSVCLQRLSGKRGAITGPAPAALAHLGHTAERWQRQVLAVGCGYFRAIGAADLLIEKAREIEQVWLRGINCALRAST